MHLYFHLKWQKIQNIFLYINPRINLYQFQSLRCQAKYTLWNLKAFCSKTKTKNNCRRLRCDIRKASDSSPSTSTCLTSESSIEILLIPGPSFLGSTKMSRPTFESAPGSPPAWARIACEIHPSGKLLDSLFRQMNSHRYSLRPESAGLLHRQSLFHTWCNFFLSQIFLPFIIHYLRKSIIIN